MIPSDPSLGSIINRAHAEVQQFRAEKGLPPWEFSEPRVEPQIKAGWEHVHPDEPCCVCWEKKPLYAMTIAGLRFPLCAVCIKNRDMTILALRRRVGAIK